MYFSDFEKGLFQKMLMQTEKQRALIESLAKATISEYEKARPLVEQIERERLILEDRAKSGIAEYENIRPLIDAVQKLALRDMQKNQSYLDQGALETLKAIERFEPLQKQLEQLQPIYPQKLQFLIDHSLSFRNSIDGLCKSGLPLGLAIEPIAAEDGLQFESQIVFKKLDDIDSPGMPIENVQDVMGLSDMIPSITKDEALDFFNYLTKFPMLGLAHPIGDMILKELPNFELKDVINIRLFRVRGWDENQKFPHSELEMFSAPYGKPDQGRFNVRGHGVLYVGDDLNGTIMEVLNPKKLKLTVLAMTLKENLHILDMTEKKFPIFEVCCYQSTGSDVIKHDYLIPNFIAQCCQKIGIQGIKYESTKKMQMMNFVFFDVSRNWFADTRISVHTALV